MKRLIYKYNSLFGYDREEAEEVAYDCVAHFCETLQLPETTNVGVQFYESSFGTAWFFTIRIYSGDVVDSGLLLRRASPKQLPIVKSVGS